MINAGSSIKDALSYCGFERNTETDDIIRGILSNPKPDKTNHERLAEVFKKEDSTGKAVRKSSSNPNSILVRKCFASLGGDGAIDFYRYLDINKVVSMYRIG